MRITSLLIRLRPEAADTITAQLGAIPGVSLHGRTADGERLIVLIEDGEGYAVTSSILAVSTAPGVLATTLAYEYCDEEIAPADIAAAFAKPRTRQEETRT